MILRYLHISDLHFKHNNSVTNVNQDLVTVSMLKKIEELVETGTTLDIIFVSGDLAFSGKKEEYEIVEKFCSKLLQVTKVTQNNLFVVPGNHDVDRKKIEKEHIKWWYNFTNEDEITEVLTSDISFPIFMKKFEAFNEFANKVMGREVFSSNKYCFDEVVTLVKGEIIIKINVVGLNSSLFAGYDGDDKGKLALGLNQVKTALNQHKIDDKLCIAFFHHPFECFHSSNKICQSMLIQKADLILTGHLHEPDNAFLRNTAGEAILIGAGASFEKRESENSFNIVQIDMITGKGELQFYKYLPKHNVWKENTDVNSDPRGIFKFDIKKRLNIKTKPNTRINNPTDSTLLDVSKEQKTPIVNQLPKSDLSIRLEPFFAQDTYLANEDSKTCFLLELELKGKVEKNTKQVSANIFLILDISGSMDTVDRYPLLRKAVEGLIMALDPTDYLGIIVFSTGAEIVLDTVLISQANQIVQDILISIDRSKFKFGGGTHLAPALKRAFLSLKSNAQLKNNLVKRVYILTDGELHDSDECSNALIKFREEKVEVHCYGFGSAFDADGLKTLVKDQLGGSVKPIIREEDIVDTFIHVAEVNNKLVASEGMVTVDFNKDMICGDAWAFKPQARYYGSIKNGRFIHEIGGIESGRVYSLLFEIRLPHTHQTQTLVAKAKLTWRDEIAKRQHDVEISVPRLQNFDKEFPQRMVYTQRAYSILHAMRETHNQEAEIISLKARIELAIEEGRDPDLINALNRKINILQGENLDLDSFDVNLIDSDVQTVE